MLRKEFSLGVLRKKEGLNYSRQLEQRSVELPRRDKGMELSREISRYDHLFFVYILHFFSYYPGLIVSVFLCLLVGLFCYGDY